MARFFHVDRANALQVGQTLTLTPWAAVEDKIPDAALQQHVEELFPEGLSAHGLVYLFWQDGLAFPVHAGLYDGNALSQIRNYAIELVWEQIRAARFRELPPRFQSIFAWRSQADAARFVATRLAGPSPPVWELEGEELFRGDMNLLTMTTGLATSLAARRYWSGEALTTNVPHWESFVAPGAEVVGRVS